MDLSNIIDEVLGNSAYIGDFNYRDLIRYAGSTSLNGIGVSDEKSQKFIIVFENGSPAGVILIEDKGALFGEKAAYHLQDSHNFELFSTDPAITSALASRCRVFDKVHLEKPLAEDLPTLGGIRHSPGVLCLVILRDGVEQSGMRVSIRKGRQVIGTDTTTDDGRACFKLLNGRYDCVIMDRSQEMYTFMVDFKDSYAESVIDIGG